MRKQLNGHVVKDEDLWLYSFFDLPAFSPRWCGMPWRSCRRGGGPDPGDQLRRGLGVCRV